MAGTGSTGREAGRDPLIITLCADPNDGAHGLFINGDLVTDSGDDDVTGADDFWRDAIVTVADAIGATLVEESRYRPARRDYDGEYESFWPQRLEDMGPIEEPYVPDPTAEIVPEPLDENAIFDMEF